MHRTPNHTQEKSNASSSFRASDSYWEELIRKFSDEYKRRDHCTSVRMASNNQQRPLQQFCTGSSYEGTWNNMGMNGFGIYRFPSDVEYEGEFQDGDFHGEGLLRYPSGVTVRGTWEKGELRERAIVFADEIEYKDHDWKYCKDSDRRFSIEYSQGLRPAGESFLSADQPTKPIPEGYYDTGDGFYDLKTKIIYSYEEKNRIIRSPSAEECQWIKDNCRSNPDKIVGPCSYLYEQWNEPQIEHSDSISDTPSIYLGASKESTKASRDLNSHSVIFGGGSTPYIRHSSTSNCWARRPFIKFDPSLSRQQLN